MTHPHSCAARRARSHRPRAAIALASRLLPFRSTRVCSRRKRILHQGAWQGLSRGLSRGWVALHLSATVPIHPKGVSPDTRRILPVDNFQAPGSASRLCRASQCPQLSPCLQTLRQAGFAPSFRPVGATSVPGWHSSRSWPGHPAPTLRFRIGSLAYPRRTTGDYLAVPYRVPSGSIYNSY